MAKLESRVWEWLVASPRRAALLLGMCAFLFAVPGIGNLDGLGHTDEHFYLSIAADTYDTGHVAPTHDGDYVFQKPPLVFWLARLCMAALGRTGAAARLPGAIAAGLLVAGGTLFAAEVAGAAAAPLAGAYLLGSLALARFDRVMMLDLPLAACLGFALWAFARAVRDRGRLSPGATLVAGALASASLGIKGPIGVAVLTLAALIALTRERRLDLLRSGRFWLGVALGLGVSAPWYAWAITTHPHEFFAFHIQEQYLSRFESDHGQSRWNLLWGTLLYAAPFWPFAAVAALRPRSGVRWPWVAGWLVAFYGIFLLPKEHGLHYPLLVLIPLATLAACASPPRWTRLVVSAALVGGAVAIGATMAFPEIPRVPALAAAALALASGLSFGSGSSGRSPFGSPGRAPFGSGPRLALGALLTGAAANLAVASLAPVFARPLLSPEAAELGRREPVALFWEHPGPYRLSAGWGRDAKEVWGEQALGEAMDRGELIFAPDHALRGAPPALVARLVPVVEWRRARPYLTVADVFGAWKARDLGALGERCALYRAAPHLP